MELTVSSTDAIRQSPVFSGLLGCFGVPCEGVNNLLTTMSEGVTGELTRQMLFSQGACGVGGGDIQKHTSGLIAATTGTLRWKDPHLQQIALDRGHALALAEAYHRHGDRFFDLLQGAFTLMVADPERKRLLLAIDRIGQHNLYYCPGPDRLIFGSTADCLRRHPDTPRHLSLQGIYNYLYFHMIPSPDTIYGGYHKLPGGHYLDWQAGSLKVSPYWQPVFAELASPHPKELKKELLALIETSVGRHTDSAGVGAFLSGGLDSSTVAGMLARRRPDDAQTFSIGFAVDGYDEIPYARVAASRFKTHQHEYYVTPEDTLALIPVIAQAYDEPFGNSSALPAYHCARLAREQGITYMLAGDGGDELFGGNERYAKQQLFEHYFRLPALLRRQVLEPALNQARHLPLTRKAYSYVRQANVPLPDRLEAYNFLQRHSPDEMFTGDFLEAVDTERPLSLLREHYNAPEAASPLNRMLYMDWQRTLHDNDLVKVNRMCQLAGVEVAYPLLDDDLVSFSCRLPSAYKVRHGQLRWFYKQAMAGFLPDEIINKRKHGFGLPFGIWTRDHRALRELAYDSVNTLRKQGWLRTDFLDRAVTMHSQVHAAYYGELIWILMMLGQWLEAHPPDPR